LRKKILTYNKNVIHSLTLGKNKLLRNQQLVLCLIKTEKCCRLIIYLERIVTISIKLGINIIYVLDIYERRYYFGIMMVSPGKILKDTDHDTKWYLALSVSGLAFALFFLQTGLDLYKTGQKGMEFVLFSAIAGVAYGIVIIPLISITIWGILKIGKTNKGLKWTITSFCLSYSGALVYCTLGMIFSFILGWKTAIAFGASGVLWAVGPMIIVVREMTEGKMILSVSIVSAFACFVLLSWSYLGQL